MSVGLFVSVYKYQRCLFAHEKAPTTGKTRDCPIRQRRLIPAERILSFSFTYSGMGSRQRYQICINDDRNLYVWKETWKEDTVADFLTRLSSSTVPRLDRQRIHLSFDGVCLGETTTMRETGLEDGDELALHYGSSFACKLCTGSHNGTGYMTRQNG